MGVENLRLLLATLLALRQSLVFAYKSTNPSTEH